MPVRRNDSTSRKRALTPDVSQLDEPSIQAWTERMAVRQRDDGTYDVIDADDNRYLVDLDGGACSCPNDEYDGLRCKHVRRVAIEINLDRVPPPDERQITCANCGRDAAISRTATPRHLCSTCWLAPGEFARDRETGDTVRVVAVTDHRADEVTISELECTVSEYPSNREYDDGDVVVDVLYPSHDDSSTRQVYSFPRGRLERRSDSEASDRSRC